MKKKQVGIRIMFMAAAAGAAIYGYNEVLNHTVATVKETAEIAVVSNTSEITDTVSSNLENISTNLETVLNELNTKIDSIHAENSELKKVIESQGAQIDKLSDALKRLGITFQ